MKRRVVFSLYTHPAFYAVVVLGFVLTKRQREAMRRKYRAGLRVRRPARRLPLRIEWPARNLEWPARPRNSVTPPQPSATQPQPPPRRIR